MKPILHIGQDNLLRFVPLPAVDYLGTGARTTPGPNDNREKCKLYLMGKYFWRLARGRYGWLVLPVVEFTSPYKEGLLRRGFRSSLSILTWNISGRGSLFNLLRPGHTRVCVVDRDDRAEKFYFDYAKAVGASLYLKINILESELRQPPACPWKTHRIPLWIQEDSYPVPAAGKEYDVFYLASPDSDARRRALPEIESLRAEGFKVFTPQKRLPFEAYASALSRSWLTLSPEGLGFHCFRHCEAMLMQSVPVINRPLKPMATDLADGVNCLFYDSLVPGDLRRVVQRALSNRQRLSDWLPKLRRYALDHYSIRAVGQFLLSEMLEDIGPTSCQL